MSRLSDTRTALTAVLGPVIPGAPWRVHQFPPSQVAAPAVWIGSPSLTRTVVGSPGVSVIVSTWPVYVVADGADRRQTEQLDEVVARVWDATLAAGYEPAASDPRPLDVGGPSLRAHVVLVDHTIRALTLCPPILEVSRNG